MKTRITAAFTLVELLIVIIVIGVLSAVALPRFLDSSADAYRALNNTTVGALNTITADVMAKGRDPLNFVATYSGTNAVLIDDTASIKFAIWLGPLPYGFPVGSASSVSSYFPGGNATYSPVTMQDTRIQQSCSDLFNGLLANNGVSTTYSGYSSPGADAGITPTNPTYNTFSAGTNPTGKNGGTVNTIITPSSLVLNDSRTTPTVSTLSASVLPQTASATSFAFTPLPGACLYQLTASAKTGTAFYIYYSGGVFTAVELQ